MKRFVLLAAIALSGCAGRLSAPPPVAGFVDLARVQAGSALGRMLADGHAAVVKDRQAKIDTAVQQLQAAEKRKDKDLDAERGQAQARVQQWQAEAQRDEAEAWGRLQRAVEPLAAAIGRERHLASVDFVPAGRLWSAEDLTDEIIRRLDAQGQQAPPRK